MQRKAATNLLEIIVPVADYQDVARVVSKHAPRCSIAGKRVVLLPSEKSSSPPFMQVLAQRMSAETDAERVLMRHADWPFFHPQRSAAIGPEVDQIARECDLMISGVAY